MLDDREDALLEEITILVGDGRHREAFDLLNRSVSSVEAVACTLVASAAYDETGEFVRLLLESGLGPDCFDKITRQTAMHRAIEYKSVHLVEILLEFGANPNGVIAPARRPWT